MEMTSKMTKKIDRELILSDTLICSVLSIEAEALGTTLEKYVDRFLDVFYYEPANLEKIFEN